MSIRENPKLPPPCASASWVAAWKSIWFIRGPTQKLESNASTRDIWSYVVRIVRQTLWIAPTCSLPGSNNKRPVTGARPAHVVIDKHELKYHRSARGGGIEVENIHYCTVRRYVINGHTQSAHRLLRHTVTVLAGSAPLYVQPTLSSPLSLSLYFTPKTIPLYFRCTTLLYIVLQEACMYASCMLHVVGTKCKINSQ